MNIDALRQENEQLRQRVTKILKVCGQDREFIDAYNSCMSILGSVEQMETDLRNLEDKFDSAYEDPQDPQLA